MHSLRGFTLIELLVVVAIIGLLGSIVLTSLTGARTKSRDADRASILNQLQTALELYNNTNGHYPVQGGWTSQCTGWGGVAANSVIPGLVPTYIGSMPNDPSSDGVNKNCIIYTTSSSGGTDYKLLDYNLFDTAGPGSIQSFVDPARNFGTAWSKNTQCSGTTDTTWTWAVWSGSTSQCW